MNSNIDLINIFEVVNIRRGPQNGLHPCGPQNGWPFLSASGNFNNGKCELMLLQP